MHSALFDKEDGFLAHRSSLHCILNTVTRRPSCHFATETNYLLPVLTNISVSVNPGFVSYTNYICIRKD